MPIVLYETFDAATDEISEYRATVLRCIELSCPKVNSISVVGPLPQKNEDGTCAEWHWGFVEVSAGDVRITLAICMDTLYLYGWKRGGIHSTDPWIVLNGEKPIGLMGNHVHLPFDGNYNHIGNPHTLFMSRAYLIKAVTKLHDCDPSHPSPGVIVPLESHPSEVVGSADYQTRYYDFGILADVITAKRSNMRHVPIGIGVQGVVDTLILLGLPFDSEEGKAKKLDKYWFQILQALIETGTECMLFKEKKEERGIVKEHGEGEPKSGVNGMLEMENGEVMIEMEIDFKLIKHPPEPSEEDMPIKCPMPDPLSLIVEEVFEESRTESSQTVAELLEQKESIAETPSGTDDIEKHQTPLPEHAATAKTGSTHKSPHPKILQVFHQCKELQV